MSELRLNTDGHIIKLGADNDVSLTHVHNTGLLLNSTRQLQFNDASQNINAPSATILDINATDEIELNATLVDVNANLDVSGTITSGGIVTGTAFTAGSAVLAEAELELLDGLTAGTAIASKVVTTDGNIDTSGQRNLTISGELDAATGDFSGAVDVAGTTTAVAITASGLITANADMLIGGTTPTLTIGDAGAEDAKIVFDGNAQDYHIGLDDTTDDLVIGLGSALGTTSHIVIDETGAVTMPLQPAFIVKPTSDSSSHTLVDMATGTHTMKFGTEILDANADFASNTFTAPVSGSYQMNISYGIGNLDVTTTLLEVRVQTSNVMYRTIQNNLQNDFNADTNETQTFCGAVMVYMDADDTCTITISVTGGGGQMDVLSGSATQPQTCWSGYLVG